MIAARAADAAERAYKETEATPALAQVRWNYAIVKLVTHGEGVRRSEVDEEI